MKRHLLTEIATDVVWLAVLLVSSSVSAQLTVTGANQIGNAPLTPSWVRPANNLIARLAPTVTDGDFGEYTGAKAITLTRTNAPLTIHAYSSPQATNLAVCGNDGVAGRELVYTLPFTPNGYDLTNITVFGGWQDNGRDSQQYTVHYSTVKDPDNFIALTQVNYSPSGVPSGKASANRVVIKDSSGKVIARNVSALKFDFTSPPSENGAVGYTAITVGGTIATNDVFNFTSKHFDSAQKKLSLTWDSQFGRSYQIVHSPTLAGPWMAIGGKVLADDVVASAVMTTTNGEDFFRVKQLSVTESATGQPQVIVNSTNQTVTMANGKGDLQLRLKHGGSCLLDHVRVNGREVVAAQTGVSTGIEVGGNWATTRTLAVTPDVRVFGNVVTITNIQFASGGISVREAWQFQVNSDNIQWTITRNYLNGGMLTDTYFPGWDFTNTGIWTAGILDIGGVAWTRYLRSNASYGTHSGGVAFWKGDTCLKITPQPVDGHFLASRFSHQPSGVFSFAQSVSSESLATKHLLRRSISGLDVWAPFQVTPGTVQTTLTLETPTPDEFRNRGTFVGIDGEAVGDVLDTIARYGVVDREIVGGNGWLTGWVCLHEPFFAEMALAIADPSYTANLAASLDAWRDHALQPNGRVYSRWHHDTGDNMVPGTYDPATGYYECGWGYLLDSNSDYPINVAEQFDLTGDLAWLQSQKEPCERALDYLLSRDSNGNGLVEMISENHTEGKSSDWIDVVWASWENAFVNAKLYNALTLWSERETILGDSGKADHYRLAADKLKQSFIKPVSQGGFWNPTNGWFIYWRNKDGSIHGDNLVTPVNFAAVAYGLCDTNQRQIVLDGIEARMKQENLFHWPICFLPYAPDEGAAGASFPTYENGDIFLSWGELAVRAYAEHNPSLAVDYINRTLDQYRNDGLSYQRYQRVSQTGTGDDILAGNSMTVVGLYRNIYGIRPQWNRLVLDSHLTPGLAGTQLLYPLRGQTYAISLNGAASTVAVSDFSVTAVTPFALDATVNRVTFWPGFADETSLRIDRQIGTAVQIKTPVWSGAPANACTWIESSATTQTLTHSLSGLVPGRSYSLSVDGTYVQTIAADGAGKIVFQRDITANVPAAISLQLIP